MATLKMDGPQPATKDACLYLFRGLTIIGFLVPKSHKVLFFLWAIITNVLVTLYQPIGFMLGILKRSGDSTPSELFTSVQVFVNCVGCSSKILVFLFLYKRLLKSTKFMDKLDLRLTEPRDLEQIRKIVAFCNRAQIMFGSLYLFGTTITFLSAFIDGRPPYQLYNPLFDWNDSFSSLAIQAVIEYLMIDFLCYQEALLDSYPIVFITIIRTHLHILTRRISKLGSNTTLSNDERYEALVQCVLDHKNIMDLYNIFCPVISGTMFVQFLIIGIILGITTIHIILFADLLATISSIFYMLSVLTETFPCSYLANCLMDDSDDLPLAIFHSDWPNEESRYKQMIAFFLHNTQKPLILTAMKIFPITMNSNINVVKFAFSVYTLIKQMDLEK